MALLLHVIETMKSAEAIAFSPSDTYYSEEYFQRTLILERKRSKESGRPGDKSVRELRGIEVYREGKITPFT